MSARNFPHALKLVLVHEGGWSNHRDDPGGATMNGVTQVVYDAYRRDSNRTPRSVKEITEAELRAIYKRKYWDLIHADDMPSGVDYCLFDYGVNSGPGRAVKDLQRALGCKVDGIVGPATSRALEDADDVRLIEDICDRRLRFLKSLRTWKTFGRGWARRVDGVRASALGMVEADVAALTAMPMPEAVPESAVKAQESDQAQMKTTDGMGLSATTAGGVGQTVMERAQELQPHFADTVFGRALIAFFVLLMAVGLILLAYSQIRRIKEKGGLGGYIGSVFK